LAAVLVVGAWPRCARAQQEPATRIGNIGVEGNTKTDAELIVLASELRPGMRIDAATLERARQRILNKRVFSEVQLELVTRGDVADVRIVVKERWTLIPIPFITSSDGQTRGGVFLLESNLFGRMKLLALGATLSNQGTSVFGFYQDPSVFKSRWATRLSGLHSALVQQRRDGPDVVYAYHDTRDDFAASVGYNLARGLFVYGGGFFLHVKTRAEEPYVPPTGPPDMGGPTVELDLRATDYHSYFDEGVVLKSQHRQGLFGRRASQSRLLLQLATGTFGDQSVVAVLQALSATGDPFVDAHRLGGQTGTRGFTPLGLWAEHAATAALEYQIPLAHFTPGTWTLNGFCDTGAVLWSSQRLSFVTPGLGSRFYLKNFAFPAVGVDVAYSTRDERFVVSAAVGMSL